MIDKISWLVAYPEIVLLVMACGILLADLGVRSAQRGVTYAFALVALCMVAAIYAVYAIAGYTLHGFGGMIVSDPMGNWLKCFAALAVLCTLVYGRPYSTDRAMFARGGELYALSLFALLGVCVMIAAKHFVVLYLGLELLTLSSYALVALRRDDAQASEAAMKYFVLGALASGFLLYGLSLMYGATGSLMIDDVLRTLPAVQNATGGAAGSLPSPLLMLGLVFVVAGLAFKFGAVPFHMWVPDVYHGAPTSVTLLIASAPKLAAFAIVMRLLVQGMFPLIEQWQQMLAVLAIASLLLGNLAGLMQHNIKRMLAYSTIAQMGFVLLAFVAGYVNGNPHSMVQAYAAAMFYTLTYVLTTLAVFGVILLLAREGFECDRITDLAGLNQQRPLYAAIMAVGLLSLAGVPPLVGFYAKFAVLQALMASGQPTYVALGVYAVLMSLIGAFYYLRVIKIMYFDAPAQAQDASAPAAPLALRAGWGARAALSFNGALVLVLGLLPAGLMLISAASIERLFAAY